MVGRAKPSSSGLTGGSVATRTTVDRDASPDGRAAADPPVEPEDDGELSRRMTGELSRRMTGRCAGG